MSPSTWIMNLIYCSASVNTIELGQMIIYQSGWIKDTTPDTPMPTLQQISHALNFRYAIDELLAKVESQLNPSSDLAIFASSCPMWASEQGRPRKERLAD